MFRNGSRRSSKKSHGKMKKDEQQAADGDGKLIGKETSKEGNVSVVVEVVLITQEIL